MDPAMQDSLAGDLGPEFKNAKCLNLCELQLILGDQLRLSVSRPAEAHKHLEREGDLQQFELALLVNLLPRTPDEAKAHIPSLIRLSPARLSRIIDTLEVFRVHAS
ncbi:DNA-directed RNA polymerase II, putative [Eimeria mitis]|uniref:DNA-directed RNA polymerase II, putative n=1 Tax=Eimeria mitis TaxID=44415 RepID=U6K1V8_9EIME|nr:DNA-directed RNA polymerase II, putative [Eimeria mitis]CDJ31679.1 DNA-directed RNA polymerase II, putative [Eimeria mitis]